MCVIMIVVNKDIISYHYIAVTVFSIYKDEYTFLDYLLVDNFFFMIKVLRIVIFDH